MRYLVWKAAAVSCLVAMPNITLAQTDDTPASNPNLSCAHFNVEALSGDSRAMQSLSGVWRQESIIPATPGVTQDTPEVRITQRNADGTLLYEATACFQPLPMPGLPTLQGACAKAVGHGRWFARPLDNDWITVGLQTEGSGYGGNLTGQNCSLVRVHFVGENVIENEYGGRGERIGPAQ